MQKTNAMHVVSTAPFYYKNPGKQFRYEKFDLYNTVISALEWRKINGNIDLATDEKGKSYFMKIGFENVWDNILTIIPDDLEGINPGMFWAAGKLFALRETDAPIVMMDTDFIVWKKLHLSKRIVAAHREDISGHVYPPLAYFNMKAYYRFPIKDIDSQVLPVNTAFLYFPDATFKQFYANQSIAFMKSALTCDDYLRYMVFAEQRLLAILAEESNVEIAVLLNKDSLFQPQNLCTHLWGAKQFMRDNPDEMEKFCAQCRRRINNDFPEYSDLIAKIESQ